MVIDSSAIVAILMDEAEADIFSRVLAGETTLAISAVTFHETSIVMAGKKGSPNAARFVDEFVRDLEIEIAAATIEDALAAREAYFRFGGGITERAQSRRLLFLCARQVARRPAPVQGRRLFAD
jgi:ribonuclease VapC